MPSSTISAQPTMLQRYAEGLRSSSDQLAAESLRLAYALQNYAARCTEYPAGDITSLSDRMNEHSMRDAELAGWIQGIAAAFVQADSRSLPAGLDARVGNRPAPPQQSWRDSLGVTLTALLPLAYAKIGNIRVVGPFTIRDALNANAQLAWNATAKRLLFSLQSINRSAWLSGNNETFMRLTALSESPSLFLGTFSALGLSIVGDSLRWFQADASDPMEKFHLLHQSFWNMAFNHVDPLLLLGLAQELEQLHLLICAMNNDACTLPRPPQDELHWSSAGFALELLFSQIFPMATRNKDGRYVLPPGAMMAGPQSPISYYYDEQISLMQIGANEFLFALCGLDPENMAAAPNGLAAVIRTAFLDEHDQNAYFLLAKQRFIEYLKALPAGSELHFTGHSMGGGMILLLLNDPDVQQLLVAGQFTIASVSTFGMVRPTDPKRDDVRPTEPSSLSAELFANTEVRHYVDPEDRLANNVGKGHGEGSFSQVYTVTNATLDDPVVAHTSYSHADYSELPPDAQQLPFSVDPAYFNMHRTPAEFSESVQLDALAETTWFSDAARLNANWYANLPPTPPPTYAEITPLPGALPPPVSSPVPAPTTTPTPPPTSAWPSVPSVPPPPPVITPIPDLTP